MSLTHIYAKRVRALQISDVRVFHKEASLTEMLLDYLMSLDTQLVASVAAATFPELVMVIHILITACVLHRCCIQKMQLEKNAAARWITV